MRSISPGFQIVAQQTGIFENFENQAHGRAGKAVTQWIGLVGNIAFQRVGEIHFFRD
jgi:hypothetical protein